MNLNQLTAPVQEQDTLRVNALHALAYCPRLFYLEEVEELYTQDAAVFAGRRLHAELEREEGEDWEELVLESPELGLRGKVDALRTRDGQTILYEHKRGRCYRDRNNQPQAWESDRLQVLAYACLIETVKGIAIQEGRVRYHADNVVIKVPVTDAGRLEVREAIEQARRLRQSTERPPITSNERLCTRCSLAPVCLPEETRCAQDPEHQPLRLFPEDDEREIIHITEHGMQVCKSGEQIKITRFDGTVAMLPARQIAQIVLHGYPQVSTQTLFFCADQEIGVHYISASGQYRGSFDSRRGSIQRRIRQYQALTDSQLCLHLAKQVVLCKGQNQRKLLMRKRQGEAENSELEAAIAQIQRLLRQVPLATSLLELNGLEGNIARLYFGAMPHLFTSEVPAELRSDNRSKRPPGDRFNALLSYGYAMLQKDVMNAILTVGLEPALSFYHQPRSQAHTLSLDLMEIFRVPVVDLAVMGSINKGQWDVEEDFEPKGQGVFLSKLGRRKFIKLYEQRKEVSWKHPALGYSLTYRRMFELEVRLLEKEWSGEGGLFGKLVIR
jgi:CRISPR-associated protein Cas1